MPVKTFRLLSISTAAALLGKSEGWLRNKILRGQGPPAKKVSPRCVEIRADDFERWLEDLPPVMPTGKEGA